MHFVKICTVSICSFLCIALAAQNLVVNPSFEDYDSCVLNISSCRYPWVNDWSTPTYGTTDYFNFCSPNPSCQPYNLSSINRQQPRTGNATAGILPMQIQANAQPASEFVKGRLSVPLIKDSVYCISFYLSLSEYYNLAIDQFGVYLSDTFANVNGFFPNVVPQVQNSRGAFYADTLSWMKWQGTYRASGGERCFIIGNFNSFSSTNYQFSMSLHGNFQDSISYYYIDDVSVEEVPSTYALLDIGNDSTLCTRTGFSHPLSVPPIYDSIKWNTGSTANSITVTDTGTYSIVAYFSDCEARDTIRFSLHSPPPTYPLSDTSLCEKALPILIASPFGFESYAWSNGSNDSIASIAGGGIFTLSAWDGCNIYRDTFAVTELPTPPPPISVDSSLCQQNAAITLQANGQDVRWYTDSVAGTQIGGPPTVPLTDAISITYYATQTIHNCESERIPLKVSVKPLPYATIAPRHEPCRGEVYTLKLTADNTYAYLWGTGETTNSICIDSSGTYTYTVSNDCGSISGSTEVRFINCNTCLYVPQAFTPNGDGNNDVFRTYTACVIKYYELRIFNRWGEKIFETNDALREWDGFYRGAPQPANVYVYTVTLVDEDDKTTAIKGSLTLIR